MNTKRLIDFLFNSFPQYDKENILFCFFRLDDDVIDIFYKSFCLDLYDKAYDGVISCGLSKVRQDLFSFNVRLVDFYNLYVDKGYLVSEILDVLNSENRGFKELIYKKYGESLDRNLGYNFTLEELIKLYRVIPLYFLDRLQEYRKLHPLVGIDDVFRGYSFTLIRNAVNALGNRNRKYFYEIFGSDLSNKFFYRSLDGLVDDKRKALLIKKMNYLNKSEKGQIGNKKALYNFFSVIYAGKRNDESIYEFKYRVRTSLSKILDESEIDILFKCYGKTLEENNPDNVTVDQIYYFNSVIVPKLVFNLRPFNETNMYVYLVTNFLDFFDKTMIFNEIENLSDMQKLKLYSIDILRSIDFSDEEALMSKNVKSLLNVILLLKKRLLRRKSADTGIAYDDLISIYDLIKNRGYVVLSDKYGDKISLAITIKLKFPYIRRKSILDLTGVSKEEYNTALKDFLILSISKNNYEFCSCNLRLEVLLSIYNLLEKDEFLYLESVYGYDVALAIMIKLYVKNATEDTIEELTGLYYSAYSDILESYVNGRDESFKLKMVGGNS